MSRKRVFRPELFANAATRVRGRHQEQFDRTAMEGKALGDQNCYADFAVADANSNDDQE